jgi:hypothetical protein
MTGIHVTYGEVAAALALVAIAVAVSLWQRSGVADDIGVAVRLVVPVPGVRPRRAMISPYISR